METSKKQAFGLSNKHTGHSIRSPPCLSAASKSGSDVLKAFAKGGLKEVSIPGSDIGAPSLISLPLCPPTLVVLEKRIIIYVELKI